MGQREDIAGREKVYLPNPGGFQRVDAGKIQDYMAKGHSISRKTVQNWEKGVTAPEPFIGSKWFRVLSSNPLVYDLFYFPDSFTD